MNESGYERNTAVFVFEATITLTEAGLHQTPGRPSQALPQSATLHCFLSFSCILEAPPYPLAESATCTPDGPPAMLVYLSACTAGAEPCRSVGLHTSVWSRAALDARSLFAGLGLATVPLVFSYIEMLRQAGPQRWVFDELAAVAEQRFRFADDEEASEYVSRLAASLPLYAPEHALNGPHVHEAWRPDLVRSCHNLILARQGFFLFILPGSWPAPVRWKQASIGPAVCTMVVRAGSWVHAHRHSWEHWR